MFGIMKSKTVVSNIRLPEDEWLEAKSAAASLGLSFNQYIRQSLRTETVKSITGIKKVTSKATGYEALDKLIKTKFKRRPMGASENDKIIYDI